MSEDAPRLSRKQMREQGLLKPVTEGTSPVEKLQMTQEIDLGRLSRKQMRELERQAARQREEAPQEAGPRRSVFERFDAGSDASSPADNAPARSASSAPSAPSAPAPSAPSPVSAPSAPSAATPASAPVPAESKPTVGNSGGVRWPGFGSGPAAEPSQEEPKPAATPDSAPSNAADVSTPVSEPQEEAAPRVAEAEVEAEEAPALSPYEVPTPARRQRASEELPRVEAQKEAPADEPQASKSSRPRIVLMYVIGALVGLLLGIPVGLLLKNLLFSAAAGTVSTVLGAFGLAGGIPGLL